MSDTTLVDSLTCTRFRLPNSHHPIIIVGDFNVHECEWLGSSFPSDISAALCGFCYMDSLNWLTRALKWMHIRFGYQ